MQIVCLFMVILSSILNRRVIGFRYLPGKSFLSSSLKSKTTKKTTMSTETCAALPIAPVEVFRRDYTPSPFYTSDIFLSFKISPELTMVTATSKIYLNKLATIDQVKFPDLFLDGEELKLHSVKVNGNVIPADYYIASNASLTVQGAYLKPFFVTPSTGLLSTDTLIELETVVEVHPDKNLALSGLYKSGDNLLCTQCEAMGFRRIAFHQDRPDILSKYKVYLEANKEKFPVLLSNGNQISTGVVNSDPSKHWAIWEDPFPKPSYLFALVAGNLDSIHDTYVTTSGRHVRLGIYSEKRNAAKLDHAMYSLKRSMIWDEKTFGLECDLDIYNVVATDDFNMGAMENKGLNIFNSAYVLADSKSATDTDYERILGVIGHEYFHNWSGNRVTVRDWFQLTLKEGLTVFRDQWFTSDETSHAVKRVEDVRGLRSRQFPEDQGPMSHPIRPDSYISMDNFYTATVYVKGAEVVRMYKTLLGEEGFKKGMELYIKRHDGGAVTCDDFRTAMSDANGVDLSQFERWYSQAGTPILTASEEYDAQNRKYTLRLQQTLPATPGQTSEEKLPLLLPVVVGLISRKTGKELVSSTVLKLTKSEEEFVFENVSDKPILSLLRDFSAPVKLQFDRSDADLALLMAVDTDAFNKWDAADKLSSNVILKLAKLSVAEIAKTTLPEDYIGAFRSLLQTVSATSTTDPSLVAYALQLPDEATLMQEMAVIDIESLHTARKHVKKSLASSLQAELERVYTLLAAQISPEYQFNPEEVSRRRLKNTCLDYLCSLGTAESLQRAKNQYDNANCMTDRVTSLACLASKDSVERSQALAHFYAFTDKDPLMLNKWFSIQAMADMPTLLSIVKELRNHPDFIISNPNRARSLLSVFAGNYAHFHASDGEGYRFIADHVIELDALNPQVAARMASAFSQWKRFDVGRQGLMKTQLERIQATKGLSKDTFEVVSRCLK